MARVYRDRSGVLRYGNSRRPVRGSRVTRPFRRFARRLRRSRPARRGARFLRY